MFAWSYDAADALRSAIAVWNALGFVTGFFGKKAQA